MSKPTGLHREAYNLLAFLAEAAIASPEMILNDLEVRKGKAENLAIRIKGMNASESSLSRVPYTLEAEEAVKALVETVRKSWEENPKMSRYSGALRDAAQELLEDSRTKAEKAAGDALSSALEGDEFEESVE
jgi:hypothetical protein